MAKPNKMPTPIRGMPMARPPMAPPPPMPGKTPLGFAGGTSDINSRFSNELAAQNASNEYDLAHTTKYTPTLFSSAKSPTAPLGPSRGPYGALEPVNASQDEARTIGGNIPMATKVPGFAEGTPSVPAPGQTVTNGSWTGPQPQPAPVPLGGQNQNLRKSLGMGLPRYAEGTSSVPAPGQTITNGSWEGPTTPPPTPAPQGQGQDLRAKLGMGVKRYASGTQDVPPEPAQGYIPEKGDYSRPGAQGSGEGMSPGYDPQSGSYPAVDEHFVAHLRAAMGMAPKMPAYAGGTSNVPGGLRGFDLSGAPGFSDFTMGGPQQGPNLPQDQGPPQPMFNKMPPAGQPFPPQASAPAGSVQPVPTIGQMVAAPARVMAGASAINPAQTPPNPGIAPPMAGPTFGGLMDALTSVPQTVATHTGFSKNIPDPHQNDAVSKAVGADPNHTNAMHNPLHYTRDEFVQAIANQPLAVTEKLWNMQHYLNPQQQLQSDYGKGLDRDITDANASQPPANAPKATLDAWKAKLAAATAEKKQSGKFVMEGPQAILDR